jgi:uncharacterized membrane protein YiaA
MKNNPHISRVLEIFWLIVFIGTLLIGFYNTIQSGLSKNYMFFVMSAMAFLLYLARRSLRKKAND